MLSAIDITKKGLGGGEKNRVLYNWEVVKRLQGLRVQRRKKRVEKSAQRLKEKKRNTKTLGGQKKADNQLSAFGSCCWT